LLSFDLVHWTAISMNSNTGSRVQQHVIIAEKDPEKVAFLRNDRH